MRRTLFLASMVVPLLVLGGLGFVAFACLPDLAVAPPPNDTCGSGFVNLTTGEACDPGDAGAFGCTSTCQIDCDGGAIDPQTNHCYFWIDGVVSIDNAIDGCNLAGAHLVNFVDLQELQLVVTKSKTLPGAPDSGSTWLALEKTAAVDDAGFTTYFVPLGTGSLPGWSASCAGCFALADGGDADLPLGGTNPQDCVNWRRSTSAAFTQGVCTLTTPGQALCEREPAGAFSAPCADAGGETCIAIPRTSAQKKYVLVNKAKTFDLAKSDCIARGGTLARFESSAEREEVMGEICRNTALQIFDVWIGLSFDDDAGAWSWLDGTPASALPLWGDGEPSVNAGAASIHIEPQRFDTRLVRAQADTSLIIPYLCQLAK